MDPLWAWLDAQDDLDGKSVGDVRADAMKALGLERLSAKAFGGTVELSARWMVKHTKAGNILWRRPVALPTSNRPCGECGKQFELTPAEMQMPADTTILCDPCATAASAPLEFEPDTGEGEGLRPR